MTVPPAGAPGTLEPAPSHSAICETNTSPGITLRGRLTVTAVSGCAESVREPFATNRITLAVGVAVAVAEVGIGVGGGVGPGEGVTVGVGVLTMAVAVGVGPGFRGTSNTACALIAKVALGTTAAAE